MLTKNTCLGTPLAAESRWRHGLFTGCVEKDTSCRHLISVLTCTQTPLRCDARAGESKPCWLLNLVGYRVEFLGQPCYRTAVGLPEVAFDCGVTSGWWVGLTLQGCLLGRSGSCVSPGWIFQDGTASGGLLRVLSWLTLMILVLLPPCWLAGPRPARLDQHMLRDDHGLSGTVCAVDIWHAVRPHLQALRPRTLPWLANEAETFVMKNTNNSFFLKAWFNLNAKADGAAVKAGASKPILWRWISGLPGATG